MTRKPKHSAFTLVELLVVIAIIGVLVALLLPAIQAAREAANRASCLNNCKQIGIAVMNYEGAFESLPIGAVGYEGTLGYGASWWVALMPLFEETTLGDDWDYGERSGIDDHAFPSTMPGDRDDPSTPAINEGVPNIGLVHTFAPQFMLCPSSPLLPTKFISNANVSLPPNGFDIAMPHYVGIMGADDTTMRDATGLGLNPRLFTNITPSALVEGTYGVTSTGGVFLVNDSNTIASVTDGTASTMVVGEISDFFEFTDSTGTIQVRRDAGWADLAVNAGAWTAGTNTDSDTFRSLSINNPETAPTVNGGQTIWNLNVIRYKPGQKEIDTLALPTPGFLPLGIAPSPFKGCDQTAGPNLNAPLVSAHTKGFSSAFLDGSTHFLNYDIDFQILLRMATRHDGIPLGDY